MLSFIAAALFIILVLLYPMYPICYPSRQLRPKDDSLFKEEKSRILNARKIKGQWKKGNLGNKVIVCRDCQEEFFFSSSAHEYFSRRGITEDPERCPWCYLCHKRSQRGRFRGPSAGNAPLSQ